jgi:hypothetical protein
MRDNWKTSVTSLFRRTAKHSHPTGLADATCS